MGGGALVLFGFRFGITFKMLVGSFPFKLLHTIAAFNPLRSLSIVLVGIDCADRSDSDIDHCVRPKVDHLMFQPDLRS